MSVSDWIALGELLVAIIGIVVGCIGGKELHEANKIKLKFSDLNAKIEKIEVNASQVAETINNNGLDAKDTEYLAGKIVDEKIKNKPDIFLSEKEPEESESCIWFQILKNDK